MAAPSASTNGTLIPDGRRGEYVHLLVGTTNAVTVRCWGMEQGGEWYTVETFAWTDGINRAEPLKGLAAYNRVYGQITSITATQLGCNVAWGFGD
ncbi:MAG: hypothetical protein ACYTEQ_18205 [Planctomycetota bacterium]